MIYTIAIDGPAGSGKSTIAKLVAKQLGITYLDTGAMYRAITHKVLNRNMKIEEGPELDALLADTRLEIADSTIWIDGEDVTSAIRSPEVTAAVSAVSSLASVRQDLVQKQQEIARGKSIVMDGRDIGSKVLPDATLKIFLTATPEERGRRRWLEMKAKGQAADLDEIIRDIARRDTLDSTRTNSPLICTPDALMLDTSEMSIDEVTDWIVAKLVQKAGTQ